MQLLHGFGTIMCFHQTHQNIQTCLPLSLRRCQHGVGLAYASVGAEVNTQLTALRLLLRCLQLGNQRIRIGAYRRRKWVVVVYRHRVVIVSVSVITQAPAVSATYQ